MLTDHVLRLLHDNPQGLRGLEVVARSQGRIRRWLVYILLGWVEEQGLVSVRTHKPPLPGCLPRRVYTLSAAGARRVGVHY